MLSLKGNRIRCGAVLLLLVVIFLSIPSAAMAAQIRLSWDKNKEITIIGYRVYGRLAHEDYDYDKPFWFGSENSCVIRNLEDNTNYYFVVRAFTITDRESDDSDEIEYDYENDYGPEAGMETDINVDYGLDGNGFSAITDSGKGFEAGSGCFIGSVFCRQLILGQIAFRKIVPFSIDDDDLNVQNICHFIPTYYKTIQNRYLSVSS